MNPSLRLQILQYLQRIPYGKVTTYKSIGLLFGIHPRAVASVMKYNQRPDLYPCYKVIASSGKISGYNTEIWIPEKIAKLEAEGISVIKGKIDKKFIY